MDNFNLSIIMDWLQRGARSRSHGVASCPTQVVVVKMETFASFEPSRAGYFSATYSNRGNHILAPVIYPSVYMMCCLVTDQGYVESIALLIVASSSTLDACHWADLPWVLHAATRYTLTRGASQYSSLFTPIYTLLTNLAAVKSWKPTSASVC